MSEQVLGTNAAGAQMGFSADLGWGYIENLEARRTAEVEEVKDHTGAVQLVGIEDTKVEEVTFDYVTYQRTSDFASDEAVAAFGGGAQISIPEITKGIYVTGITKRFATSTMVRISCEGKMYDNISTTTTTTT